MISPCFALHHKKSIQKYQATAARDPSQYHESHEYHEYHPGAPNISPKVGTCRPHGLQGSQQWWCYPCAWWWSRDRFETLWKSLKTYDFSGFPSFKNPSKNTHVNNKQTIECMMGFFSPTSMEGHDTWHPEANFAKFRPVFRVLQTFTRLGSIKTRGPCILSIISTPPNPFPFQKSVFTTFPETNKSLLNDLWKTILSFGARPAYFQGLLGGG